MYRIQKRWPRHWPQSTTESSAALSTAHNSCNALVSSSSPLLLPVIPASVLEDVIPWSFPDLLRDACPITEPLHSAVRHRYVLVCVNSCFSTTHIFSLWCVSNLFFFTSFQLIARDLHVPSFRASYGIFSIYPIYIPIIQFTSRSRCRMLLIISGRGGHSVVGQHAFLFGHMTQTKRCRAVLIFLFYEYIEP